VSTVSARWGDALARLPVQPAVSARLLELTRNPAVTVQQVAGLVELDPALTARVIRLANVPYRGLRTPVTTARRAVVLLGVSTVRALVASFATRPSEEDSDVPGDFWARSVLTASAAAGLAQRVGLPSPEAFTAGVLHDVGEVLLHQRDPSFYADRAGAPSHVVMADEREVFGVDHAEVGATALADWRLPPIIVRAVKGHHAPPSEQHDSLARLIGLADWLAESASGDRAAAFHGGAVDALGLAGRELRTLGQLAYGRASAFASLLEARP